MGAPLRPVRDPVAEAHSSYATEALACGKSASDGKDEIKDTMLMPILHAEIIESVNDCRISLLTYRHYWRDGINHRETSA